MDKNKIIRTLENIVKDLKEVNLHDNGNYPVLDPEYSRLYFYYNGYLVWKRFLGTGYDEAFLVKDLDDNELEILLDLLLDNGIITRNVYDYLIG